VRSKGRNVLGYTCEHTNSFSLLVCKLHSPGTEYPGNIFSDLMRVSSSDPAESWVRKRTVDQPNLQSLPTILHLRPGTNEEVEFLLRLKVSLGVVGFYMVYDCLRERQK
jgi:hypothetical protein